jgi:hypothetical protein
MKIFIVLLLSVIFLQVNAQQRFEGMIVYQIDAKQYISNISVSMVYDNKILLGITIIDPPRYEDPIQDTIHIRAKSVLTAAQPASTFRIPEDFSPEVQAVAEPPAPVDIEAVPDTVTTPPPPMLSPEPVAAPAKTIKKRSTITKSPMRKPVKKN